MFGPSLKAMRYSFTCVPHSTNCQRGVIKLPVCRGLEGCHGVVSLRCLSRDCDTGLPRTSIGVHIRPGRMTSAVLIRRVYSPPPNHRRRPPAGRHNDHFTALLTSPRTQSLRGLCLTLSRSFDMHARSARVNLSPYGRLCASRSPSWTIHYRTC